MSDRSGKEDIQILVTAMTPGSLPDVSALRRHFQHDWRDISVESTKDGHLLTFEGWDDYRIMFFFLGPWLPGRSKRHTVAGHHVQMNLVVPDVYGCQVTLTPGHVEVNVGRDVIDRITRDEQLRDRFLQKSMVLKCSDMCVQYMSMGHIAVTRSTPAFDSCRPTWDWEVDVISILIDLLSPFQAAFPTAPRCVRDRCLDRCGFRSVQELSSSDSGDCQTDVIIAIENMHRVIVCKDRFLQKMHTAYPRVQFIRGAEQKTLTLKGNDNTVREAAEDILRVIKNLTRNHIRLTHSQTMMMKNPAAQNLFQQSLDKKGVVCAWKLESIDRPPAVTLIRKRKLDGCSSRSISPARSLQKEPASLISVTASERGIQTCKETFQSCFQTTDVVLAESQVPDTQSDSWKQFLENLQNSRESTIAPVVEVEQDQVTICDLTSNIDTTRRAVLDFFHKRMIDQHKQFCDQKTTETITTLQTWQMKFLTTAQNKKHLPSCLQQSVSVNSEDKYVLINAPFHMVDKYVGIFWKYLGDLSQRMTALTAASTHKLQMSDIRERVQSLLDKEGVVCDWHLQQGTLVISAHQSDLQRVEHIFMTEIKTTQLDHVSLVSQQTEDWHTERTGHPAECSPLSSPSVTVEQQVGTSQLSIPEISSRTSYCVSSPGGQDRHNPVTQQPGCPRGPPTRAAPAPPVLEGGTESGMNNTVHVPRADTSADRPSEGVRSLGNRNQQSSDVVETPHDDLASLTTQEDHPGHRHSSQSTHTAPTVTTTNTNSDSSVVNQLQLQLNSSLLARLANLEHKVSLMDRERVHEPSIPMETRIINIQHQLDTIIQRQDYSRRQQNDTDSDVIVIGNPSATDSASSASMISQQQGQREQQQRQQQLQPQQQQQPQQQHQRHPRQSQQQRQQNNNHSGVMMICNPSDTDSVDCIILDEF